MAAPTTAKPTFVADVAGTYVASLTVNDGKINSAAVTTSVITVDAKKIGIAYLARNGMTVTLVSLTTTDLGNGYNRFTAAYKEENNTAASINQATLRLYFTNDAPAAHYGSFGKILPGASFAQSSSYTFDVPKTSTPLLLQYDADHFFATQPVAGALQWTLPVSISTVSQGGLNWIAALQNPYLPWDSAVTHCTNGTFNGRTGWRLPTQSELTNLAISGAINGLGWQETTIWSSTPSNTIGHYQVNLITGDFRADNSGGYVACVQ